MIESFPSFLFSQTFTKFSISNTIIYTNAPSFSIAIVSNALSFSTTIFSTTFSFSFAIFSTFILFSMIEFSSSIKFSFSSFVILKFIHLFPSIDYKFCSWSSEGRLVKYSPREKPPYWRWRDLKIPLFVSSSFLFQFLYSFKR